MFAAGLISNAEIVKVLIESGAEANARTNEGWTPLMFAAGLNDRAEILEILIAAGAEVNARDKGGWTPLMHAAQLNDSVEVVEALIAAGAEVNTENEDGSTPLMIAAYFSGNPNIVGVLCSAGADTGARNKDYWTPLMLAASNTKNPEVIKALIACGADVNEHAVFVTPLMIAAAHNDDPEIVKVLIASGADVNASRFGQTALMCAASFATNPGIVEALLEAGADGTLKSREDKTAFDYAKENPAIRDTRVYWLLDIARASSLPFDFAKIKTKSGELLSVTGTLLNNTGLLGEIYFSLSRLRLGFTKGDIPTSSMKKENAEKQQQIQNMMDSLEELYDDIASRRQEAMPDDRNTWGLASSCAQQLSSTSYSLMQAAMGMESMATRIRFSEGWMREYEVTGLELDVAKLHLDLAGLIWSLLMDQQ
jgi:ankyrin repeat protein